MTVGVEEVEGFEAGISECLLDVSDRERGFAYMLLADLDGAVTLWELEQDLPLDSIEGHYGGVKVEGVTAVECLDIAGGGSDLGEAAGGVQVEDEEATGIQVLAGAREHGAPIVEIGEVVDGVENAEGDVEGAVELEAGDGALVEGGGGELVAGNFEHFGGLVEPGQVLEVRCQATEDGAGATAQLDDGGGRGQMAFDVAADQAHHIGALAHNGVVVRCEDVVVVHEDSMTRLVLSEKCLCYDGCNQLASAMCCTVYSISHKIIFLFFGIVVLLKDIVSACR